MLLLGSPRKASCRSAAVLSGGAAGNRTRRRYSLDLRKHRESLRETTRNDAGRPANTPEMLMASTRPLPGFDRASTWSPQRRGMADSQTPAKQENSVTTESDVQRRTKEANRLPSENSKASQTVAENHKNFGQNGQRFSSWVRACWTLGSRASFTSSAGPSTPRRAANGLQRPGTAMTRFRRSSPSTIAAAAVCG